MSAFTNALRSYHDGSLSQDELLAEIYRQLAVDKTSPRILLDSLKIHQFAEPLPQAVHESLVNRIVNWPQDPTIVTGATETTPIASAPGRQVGDALQGRFKLVELIGEGGMSRVFKAIDLRRVEAEASDPYVAVKVLTEPAYDYFGSLAALHREAHKLQRLSHPNIVRVMDCDRDEQTVFMTMEYLAGGSLQKKLLLAGSAGIPASTANAILADVADALQYAHDNGIVHGDLKPGNVIIAADGTPKVIDFGMAHFVVQSNDSANDPNAYPNGSPKASPRALTPRYASPELLAGATPKATDDVYALGCIAYEMLSGQHPFGRRGEPGARALTSIPPRQPQFTTAQYSALVNAVAFDETRRTPTIAKFMSEFSKSGRASPFKPRAAAAVVACCLLGVLVFALLSKHGPTVREIAEPRPMENPLVRPALTGGSAIRDCTTCPLMTLLVSGKFEQGAADGDADQLALEGPVHEVTIGYALAMSANEITVAEFREFVEATRRPMSGCTTYEGRWEFQSDASWESPGFSQTPRHPVTCASWNDAVAYAAWLSKKSGHAYRLPSASEWEYAARAGTDLAQPWAADGMAACGYANVADQSAVQRYPGWTAFACSDGYANTAPVGSFKANAFGLNDMLGNAFEWVQDCWHSGYVNAPVDGSARMDGDCREHELRGGSWFSSPRFVSAAYRNRFAADYRSSSVGFRLVREVSQ